MKNINRLNMKSFLCLLFFLLTFIDFLHSQVVHQMTFTRFHHYEKSQELLIYVKKRYARKKNKKI